jgi:surface protein
MLGKRGLGGPFFQRVGQRLYMIGTPGNRTGIRVSGGLSASSTEGANPTALTLVINATDENGDPVAWSISESLTWASFSPTSGTGETSVTVTLDPVGAGLTPGAYTGEFTITAAGAENSPYTGTLRLTYYESPVTPVLAVAPVSLDFGQITEGDGLPAAQTLTVTNSASPASSISFTAAGLSWLDVSQSGATVTVRPNTSAVGTYSGNITITSASASNSPLAVPVTFTVQEQKAPSLYDPAAAVIEVEAPAAATTVFLPTLNNGTYDAEVDWGDGTVTSFTAWNDDANRSHTYADAGVYAIQIKGLFTSWDYNTDATVRTSQSYVKRVLQWGSLGLTLLNNAFRNCGNLVEIAASDGANLAQVSQMAYAFYGCAKLTTVNTTGWDTSNITNMSLMFRQCSKLQSIDISDFDFSFLTTAPQMFLVTPAGVIPPEMYDALLQKTANLPSIKPNVAWGMEGQKYTLANGQAFRDILTNAPNNWVITDAGGISAKGAPTVWQHTDNLRIGNIIVDDQGAVTINENPVSNAEVLTTPDGQTFVKIEGTWYPKPPPDQQ